MKKFLSISFVIVIVDRVLKMLVENFLTSKKVYVIKNFFYLVFTKNDGAAFSMMEGMKILLIFVGIAASVFIYYYVKKNNIKNIGYSLLLGGIIGNLIDRIVYGYVIDYIGFKIFSYNAPIFNLADMAIVIGAFIILIGSDKYENNGA